MLDPDPAQRPDARTVAEFFDRLGLPLKESMRLRMEAGEEDGVEAEAAGGSMSSLF